MAVNVDLMEYSSDANAQAAYVSDDTSGYGSDEIGSGSASASNEGNGSAGNAIDGNTATRWAVNNWNSLTWWKYDFGSGVTKIITKLRIYTASSTWDINGFVLEGSNNDSSWTAVHTSSCPSGTGWNEFTFSNTTPYRYYRVRITSNHGAGTEAGFWEIQMMENFPALQVYSEASLKTEGSYALKAIAKLTDSLNNYIERTIGSPIDLSGQTKITFDIRSSRTGQNLTIRLGNGPSADILSGGTPSASGVGGGAASNGVDDSIATAWADTDGSPWWWQYDFGAGNEKTAIKIRFYRINSTWSPKDWKLEGSNNGSSWTTLTTVTGTPQAAGWVEQEFSNTTAYRYYRFTITANWGAGSEGRVHEFELMEETYHEYQVTINSADTYESKEWDISSIADGDKDNIETIRITIDDADAENTFYIDNIVASALSALADTLTIKYNILNNLNDALTIKYHILNFLNDALTIKYNILNFVSDSLTVIYNILAGIINDALTIKYNILNNLNDALTIKYNILNNLNDALTVVYNIKENVFKAPTFIWNILNNVFDSLTVKYHIKNLIGDTLTIIWDITQKIQKTLSMLYNILEYVVGYRQKPTVFKITDESPTVTGITDEAPQASKVDDEAPQVMLVRELE